MEGEQKFNSMIFHSNLVSTKGYIPEIASPIQNNNINK